MALDALSRRLIALALEEDLGASGDLTSTALLSPSATGRASILVRDAIVLAGTEAFSEVFAQLDPSVRVQFHRHDGDHVPPSTVVGEVEGSARSLLSGERTALNLLQRLSGIATAARAAMEAVKGTKAKIVDTRKTTPGLRALEKAAVRAGGAQNHRFGLFDGVLIKDNHLQAVGGVAPAIAAARASGHHLLKIECEVTTLAQVDEALAAGADVILLDNMDLETMKRAVQRIGGRALVEASGGMTLPKLKAVAGTGVDLISMGALTHTVVAADIALEWEPLGSA